MKCLGAVVQMEGIENELLRRLVVMGLEDPVAAVREAAVAAVSGISSVLFVSACG